MALNVRVALGALLIKEILQLSDREVVESVSENPYLQYFLGFKTFQTTAPFSASLLTHFRKRLPKEVVMSFNDKVIALATKASNPEEDPPPPNGGGVPTGASNATGDENSGEKGECGEQRASDSSATENENSGIILMDATCVPADIKYPTDLNLVNDARELTENIIDKLREQCCDTNPRPRTGHYPEAVLADKLFRNRENLRYCAEHGILLSGPRLGRPAKIVEPEFLKQQLADSSARNAIEGKFGQCKRRLGLGRVMARRRDCSETVIAMTFLAANLIRWLLETETFFAIRFRPVFFMDRITYIIPFFIRAA